MWYTLSLYFRLVGVRLRSQMQYKSSFWMLFIAYFFSTAVDIIGMWVLFDRFKIVRGWTLAELSLVYGVMNMGFAIAEATARGFDTFYLAVKSGEFDRMLLRPCSTLLQVATREVHFIRFGRFLQGGLIFLWGFSQLGLIFLSWTTLLFPMAIICSACLFYGLFIIQGTLSFWTVESLELMNIVTFGGLQAGQYPMSIYTRKFRAFFTFVIPIACVSYYPIATFLGKEPIPAAIGLLLPLLGVAFLVLACQLWKLGVRHYHSTGS